MQELQKLYFFPALAVLLALCVAPTAKADPKRLPEHQEQITLSFAPLVKKAAPAVVNIYTSKQVQQPVISPFLSDPLFQQFFGQNDLFFGRSREKVVNSLGSGTLVSTNGIIVTNNHVISGAQQITVVLNDRREFEAEILLTDPRTDLAVLKIKGNVKDLPYLDLDDSDMLEVGDLILAIGNPFGVGQTVTSGIVSALARTNVEASDYQFFIQTDAAINPGNSGGPLINMAGKVAGINTAIFTKTGGSIGIGFATPANMAKVVIASAERGGKIIRPWLGALTQNITQPIADAMQLETPSGVLVKQVYPGSAADRAGLRAGDVIVAVNEKTVGDEQALRFRIATLPLGNTQHFTVVRNNSKQLMDIMMEAPPETTPRDETKLEGTHPLDGLIVANLSPAVADEMDMEEYSGVVVTGVWRRSTAWRLGFRESDIINKINNSDITAVKQLQQLLKRSPLKSWNIEAKRGEQLLTILVN